MGIFDYYEPDPALHCPVCDALLSGWQGKCGPNALFVWRQGERFPIAQAIDDDEVRLDPDDLQRFELPQQFDIYAPCCGERFFVVALCEAPNRVWSSTELVTAENAKQWPHERSQDFAARLRWLEGRAV